MNLTIALAFALFPQGPVHLDPAPAQSPARSPAVEPVQIGQVFLDVEDLLDVHDPSPQDGPAVKAAARAKPVPEAKIAQDAKSVPEVTPESREFRLQRAGSALADQMKRWMVPVYEPKIDLLEVAAPGRLSLRANSLKLDWARRFCDVQRERADLVDIEIWILDLPKGTRLGLGIDGPTKTLDRREEVDSPITNVKDSYKASILCAPRLMVLPRSHASMCVGESVSYISEWTLQEVEPGPQTIAVPKIETVFDGTSVECCAVPLDGGVYGLELKFEESKLERPVKTAKVRIGERETREVEIGLPEVKKVSLDTRASLADGASVVFASVKTYENREVAVIVTLRRGPHDLKQR
jgi:hypothetical protein